MSSSSSSSPLSPLQLALYNSAVALLNEFAASAGDVAPLQRMRESVIHQSGDSRTHADTVAVLLHLLPDVREKLTAMGGAAAKLRLWLIDFLDALLTLDALAFTPPVLAILANMTAEEK